MSCMFTSLCLKRSLQPKATSLIRSNFSTLKQYKTTKLSLCREVTSLTLYMVIPSKDHLRYLMRSDFIYIINILKQQFACREVTSLIRPVFALIIFTYILLARKLNLERFSIYSNKFFHNFHLFESSFTCPRLWASGLVQRL